MPTDVLAALTVANIPGAGAAANLRAYRCG
jgi:hypothetical protein